MSIERVILACLIGTISLSVSGATGFSNLGFENATLPDIPSGQFGDYVPLTDALPGWNAFLGTNSIEQVYHNNFTLGTASISILGPQWPSQGIFQGRYTVFLQSGHSPGAPAGVLADASITQIGQIPSTANSISFLSEITLRDFTLSVNGQVLPFFDVSTTGTYSLYTADISSFASQSVELRFTAHAAPGHEANWVHLDAIAFSAMPVPEPAFWCLVSLALGSLWCAMRRR